MGYLQLLMLACIIFLYDYLQFDTISPGHIIFLAVITTLVVVFSFPAIGGTPAAVEVNADGELAVNMVGGFRVSCFVASFYAGFLIALYFFQIALNAPRTLKRTARVSALGGFLIGIGKPLVLGLSLENAIPSLSHYVFSVGVLLITIATAREPRLAFVLPFRVYRLIVIETKGGIPLFKHKWEAGEVLADELFSGLLQGINLFVKESLRKGQVREISLEKGILLMEPHESFTITAVLLANKYSRILRLALQSFIKQFGVCYSALLDDFNQTDLFSGVSAIVKETFSFIPDYD